VRRAAGPGRVRGSPDATSIFQPGAFDEGPGDEPSEEAAGAVDALPPGSALLVVKRGPTRAAVPARPGRDDRRPAPGQRHLPRRRDRLPPARGVPPEGGGFVVHDVGSLNGTYVNRQRIDVAALAGGDEVQIGKFRLLYLAGARTGGEEPAVAR
jgi:hypothetical protein